jgi:hypothetical protein
MVTIERAGWGGMVVAGAGAGDVLTDFYTMANFAT